MVLIELCRILIVITIRGILLLVFNSSVLIWIEIIIEIIIILSGVIGVIEVHLPILITSIPTSPTSATASAPWDELIRTRVHSRLRESVWSLSLIV